jgi:hypothetical protein
MRTTFYGYGYGYGRPVETLFVLDVIPLMWIVICYIVVGLQRDFSLERDFPLCHLTLALDISMSSCHTVISLYC